MCRETRGEAPPIAVHEAGHGEPALVLVHGWGSSGATFDGVLAGLAARHRVLVPDLPGHGTSPPHPAGHRVPDLIHALAAGLDALRAGPVVALGHSLGGQIVTGLAVHHPATVHGIVVLDPAYGADEAEVAAVPARARAIRRDGPAAAFRQVAPGFSATLPEAAREGVRQAVLATPPRVLLETLESTYTGPGELGSARAVRALAARREVPVLALYSTPAAAEFERTLPSAGPIEVVTAPGPGHYLHLEHPGWVVATVLDWLGRLATGGGPASALQRAQRHTGPPEALHRQQERGERDHR